MNEQETGRAHPCRYDTAMMKGPGQERVVLGAPADSAERIVVELRAVASRHGVDITDVQHLDLCVAATGADMWATVLNVSTLADVPLYDFTASETLARIILRAAGRPAPGHFENVDGALPYEYLEAAERAVKHLCTLDDPLAAAKLVASDLGSESEKMAIAGASILAAVTGIITECAGK